MQSSSHRPATPPNRYALEYVKRRCRLNEPPLSQSDAHLLVIVGTEVPRGHTVSNEISLADCEALMRCDRKTITRARDRLIDIGELAVRDGGRGHKWFRLELLRLAGPLFISSNGSVKMTDLSRPRTSVKMTDLPEGRSKCPTIDGTDDLSSRSVVEGSTSSESHESANDFLRWFELKYLERFGVRYRPVNSRLELERVQELLMHRSASRLQLAALVMFATKAEGLPNSDQRYIAGGNRSILILHRKILFLEAEVERLRLDDSQVDVDNDDTWNEVRDRLASMVSREIFEQWFAPCKLLWVTGDLATLWVPSWVHRDRLRTEGLEELLVTAIADIVGEPCRLEFYVQTGVEEQRLNGTGGT